MSAAATSSSATTLPTQRFRLDQARRQRTVLTPEGIPLRFTLATRSARAGALLLDLFLVGAVMVATTIGLIYLAGGTAKAMGQASGAAGHALQFLFILWLAAMFLLRNAWFLFFELSPRGATPGKRASHIRIAARNGGRLTAEMVLARNLLRDIELFLPLSFLLSARDGDMGAAGIAAAGWFLIFGLFPCFNRDALRAGDIIAGTWVVEAPRRKLEQALSAARAAAPGAAGEYHFDAAALSHYGEYELQVLERVLRENRGDQLAAVYQRICGKIGWHAGAGDERAFLAAYYTQLRARLESGMRLGQRKADKFTGPSR
ncbi:RDD family protein [Novosphingobium flavum]|uniref:RDD family protein n=1 Tax=Novosphingobium flavum TaxID=1778672 RepID=A0A7X1KKJ8_9SPHN|nr:RDD family protein [Novosphingobium flavum]MBC2664348.1 RDD family protein [Novosphingobium flavum]